MTNHIQTVLNKSKEIKPKRRRAKPLIRHIIACDNHAFVGRVFDLSIVAYHFDSYEELARHPDCKYAFHINHTMSGLTQRVETLNLVGDMLWPKSAPKNFKDFPVSRYSWLTIAADVFLMRLISVVDCALILTNDVYETRLDPQKCTIKQLKKAGVPSNVLSVLEKMQKDQGDLRHERNARFHRGAERTFTDDDTTFKTASFFEQLGNGISGHDRHRRRISVERSFQEGLVELQREFNAATRKLVGHLEAFYEQIGIEFENRFTPRIRSATHGINVLPRA